MISEKSSSSLMKQCELANPDSVIDSKQDASVLSMADNSSRRPGILVLINDADWELEGEDRYELKKDDNVLFVSTLHGG